jgi:hypothetical protein
MNEEWTDIRFPPTAQKTVWLKDERGDTHLGWGHYDSLLGKRYYWAWSEKGRTPTVYVSRLQRAGLVPIKAVAWRPYVSPRITLPSEPMARREAEPLVLPVILTDGTMRGLRKGGFESSWDDSWHTDEKERGAGEMIDFEHVNKTRFMPTPKDVQNYEDGVVMSWFLALRGEGKRSMQEQLSDLQKTFVFKAYGFAYHVIGDKIDVTERQAKYLYRKAVDLVWDRALGESRPVRRLRKEDWSRTAPGQ